MQQSQDFSRGLYLGSHSTPFAFELVSRTRLNSATALKAGTVLALTGFLYTAVLVDLAHDWWTEPSASYGMLIPPLVISIAWMRRKETLAIPQERTREASFSLLALVSSHLLGKLGAEFFLQRISFVILLAGFVWPYWGAPRARLSFSPLCCLPRWFHRQLSFSTRCPDLCNCSPQMWRQHWLKGLASGYRDGNIINLANISLGVDEACSGLNSLSSTTLASLLPGFVQCGSIWARLLPFSLSIPLSIAINALTAGTVVTADYDQEFALGFYLAFSGWLIFLVGFSMLSHFR